MRPVRSSPTPWLELFGAILTRYGARQRFRLLTASFSIFPAEKRTPFVAGILIVSFVWGLCPRRDFLCDTLKVPNPTSVILSPLRRHSVIAPNTESIALSACALLRPTSPA